MSGIFRLDRASGALYDDAGACFDPRSRRWHEASPSADAEPLDAVAAATWLQRESGHPLRVPVGVIGPREATDAQLAIAREVGERLARCGFPVICGGRMGIMEAACQGVARGGGFSIGLIGDAEPALANAYASVIVTTGIGEARNALIARAAFCLVAVGDSFGTLSEVALGRHFGKVVVGLAGAATVAGVRHVNDAPAALEIVARVALGKDVIA